MDLAALQRASTVNAVLLTAVALVSCQGDSTPSLVSIQLTPAHPQLIQGETQPFKATGTYSDSSHQDVTTSVLWSSSDPATASMSNSSGSQGLATATQVGTTTILASEHGITASVTLTVVAQPRVVYVEIGDTINQYTIRSDGGLVALNPATIALTSTGAITVDSAGKHAYVAGGYVISQFGIKPDGTLSSLTPASIAAGVPQNGAQVGAFVIHPSGRFGYALSPGEPGAGDGALQQFIIQSDGTLQTSPVELKNNFDDLLFTPDGRFAYVLQCGDVNCNGSISAYAVAADGSFTKLNLPGSSLGFSYVSAFVMDPSGTYVYVAALNGNQPAILQFRIAADGGLAPLVPAAVPLPNAVPAATSSALSIHPSGRYLYVAITYLASSICEFSIGDNGVLSPLSPATLAVPNMPLEIAQDSTGSFAYVLSANVPSISEYSISASGVLTPIGDIGTGINPSDIVTAR